MQVDEIPGSISKGVVIRRHIALLTTFCEHHAFVSSFEPLKVHGALVDLDWVTAMQEELEFFTRNEVWPLIFLLIKYTCIRTEGVQTKVIVDNIVRLSPLRRHHHLFTITNILVI
jgi:hypothetical protein